MSRFGFVKKKKALPLRDGATIAGGPLSAAGQLPSQPVEPSDQPRILESLRERLWTSAYKQAKDGPNRKSVEAYERLLSHRLVDKDSKPPSLEEAPNTISKDPNVMAVQMRQLVNDGLDRTSKQAKNIETMTTGIEAVLSVKDVVDSAVTASPQAAIVWVGVCFALEIFLNPGHESQSNRDGISYVLLSMDWYWKLGELVLDENIRQKHQGIRDELQRHVVNLYEQLLLYQIDSACNYYRNQVRVFLGDLFKSRDWDSRLATIKAGEANVLEKSKSYSTEQMKEQLADVAGSAHQQINIMTRMEAAMVESNKHQESREDIECRQSLFNVRPEAVKLRIERDKETPLNECFEWIFSDPKYQAWHDDGDASRLLWVNGNPGQGKTLLLCGVIRKLEELGRQPAYFFCQASQPEINSARAVLLGLVGQLTAQQPPLLGHVRKIYDESGKRAFEGNNAFDTVAKILVSILNDPVLQCDCVMIDGLDECLDNREALVRFVVEQSREVSRVKWMVSSRPWPDIGMWMRGQQHVSNLHLEPTAKFMIDAIESYIRYKVDELSVLQAYSAGTRNIVNDRLSRDAHGTFLWVALVCKHLERVDRVTAIKALNDVPASLTQLYQYMFDQVSNATDFDQCRAVLTAALVARRPLKLTELPTIAEALADYAEDAEALESPVGRCGSFLAIRNNIVYWVHQSAKDFLLQKNISEKLFPDGEEAVHYEVVSRSLHAMIQSETLHRDIYDLQELGVLTKDISAPDPDPLAAIAYSCVFWIDHLQQSRALSAESCEESPLIDQIEDFFRQKSLYWIEALSLLSSIPDGILSLTNLAIILRASTDAPAVAIVDDALRFIRYFSTALEAAPLQAYVSGLIYCPRTCVIRHLFGDEAPEWPLKPTVSESWSPCIHVLEGHPGELYAIAASPDGSMIASGGREDTVRLWNIHTGEQLHELDGHKDRVRAVAFHPDRAAKTLASGSDDGTVRLWDVQTGREKRMIKAHGKGVQNISFSPDGRTIASASIDSTVRMWDSQTGMEKLVFTGHKKRVNALAFSPNQTAHLIASASTDENLIRLWNSRTAKEKQPIVCEAKITALSFSTVGEVLAAAIDKQKIQLWNVSTSYEQKSLSVRDCSVLALAFSPDGQTLVSGDDEGRVRIWSTATGEVIRSFADHKGSVTSVAWTPNGQTLVSTSWGTVRMWDIKMGLRESSKVIAGLEEEQKRQEDHLQFNTDLVISPDGKTVASLVWDGEPRLTLWDVSIGQPMRTFQPDAALTDDNTDNSPEKRPCFSPDGAVLATVAINKEITLWDVETGTELHRFKDIDCDGDLAFSADGTTLDYKSKRQAGKPLDVRSYVSPPRCTYPPHTSPITVRANVLHYNPFEDQWICYDGENIIWVPYDYRPLESAASGNMLVIASYRGGLSFFRIEEKE